MAEYLFLTTWLLDAERERAWDVLQDTLRWPEWWRGVESVDQLEQGDENDVGSRYRIAWRSRLPYPLEFDFNVDEVSRPSVMAGRAVGELTGTGRWRLFEEGDVTAVVYEWNVHTTKPWMNLLAPLARPVFAWNHDVVMRWGGQGLARRLGVPLLAHA
ncbi:MAG: SRPBCC family protein [Actinobacteria bacterium]|nr:SRPBCC family protein [Actinomycetota bacterium]